MVNVTRVFPQDPCRVTLGFVDNNGAPVTNSDSLPVRSQVNLAPGVATTLDLPAPSTAIDATTRFAVRPVVVSGSQSCVFQASAEIFTTATGVTTTAIPGNPILPLFPVAPLTLSGLFGIAAGQTARVSLVNVRALPLDPLPAGNQLCDSHRADVCCRRSTRRVTGRAVNAWRFCIP